MSAEPCIWNLMRLRMMMTEILTLVFQCLLKPAENMYMGDGHIWKTRKTWSKQQFTSRTSLQDEWSLGMFPSLEFPIFKPCLWILNALTSLWMIHQHKCTHAEQNWENVCFRGFCLTTLLLETEQNLRYKDGLLTRYSCCKFHGKFNFDHYFSFHEWLVVTFVPWRTDHERR